MHNAWLISIGTELILGQTVDTNAAWLAQQLAARGVRAVRHITVADELADILEILAAAVGHCDVIIITGGLGPTEDDLTRQALADFAGVPLEPHRESLERIRDFFASRHRPMHDANVVQALIPIGAEALPNNCGTAPGIFIKLRETPCFALPGVPSEMREMFEHDVAPRLTQTGRVVGQRMLHCLGQGESTIGAQIRDLMERGRNPDIGTTARHGVVGIRINATADTSAAANRMLDDAERALRARLGALIFGRDADTIGSVVGKMLLERSETLAVAESCTAGLLAKLITDASGSSQYFRGGVVAYANDVKSALLDVSPEDLTQHGAVSEPVARRMAESARRRLNATYGLSITGVAGPTGGTPDKPVGTVFIALATPSETRVINPHFGADSARYVIRQRSATAALDLLRLELFETPT